MIKQIATKILSIPKYAEKCLKQHTENPLGGTSLKWTRKLTEMSRRGNPNYKHDGKILS